ncbi:FKBP-type peptidyl-prolyl isomerase-like protein [Phyllosticta citricarpa]|uniref:peptidylprolyl isomerase n=3 Tax=Phyllosticta TaxID=121621 RepID=A0ABR1M494_9PEZI
MGVEKQTIKPGDGVTKPQNGDTVTMEYTGYLQDASGAKGKQFDSSVGRGDFQTAIGVGRVIKGWDEGIVGTASQPGMTLGEKATLTITADYGYGASGFPGVIPPNATLIFDVELKGINNQRA